jgi:hypothetical protein
MKKSNAEKQALLEAKFRQKEIARKVAAQKVQASGHVPSKLGQMLSKSDDFTLKGRELEIYNRKESIRILEGQKREAKRQAEGFSHKYVKRDMNGKTLGVDKVFVK